jgi:ubiquinone/menaquinone biosynthesis C-methylase UbiE
MGLRHWNEKTVQGEPWWGEYMAQYIEAAKLVRGKNVLDLGCGKGFGTRHLFDAGALEVLGIDKEAQEIEYANKYNSRDGVVFQNKDAETFNSSSQSFDVVTCFQILEKSPRVDQIIQNISKVLAPSGVAILTTVNRKRFSVLHEAPAEPDHLQEFDLTELKNILKKSFSIIDIKGLQSRRPAGLFERSSMAKIADKIPQTLREGLSKSVFGQSFYPGQDEYEVKTNNIEKTPLFYAICKKI